MSEELFNFVETEQPQTVITLLKGRSFEQSVTRHRDSEGNFFFRVREGQKTIGRSKTFESAESRDRTFSEFLDWIEVRLHGNLQRSFDFGW